MSAGISVLSKLLVAALETGANVARNNNITAVENMLKSAGLFVEEVDAAMQENPALAVSAVAVGLVAAVVAAPVVAEVVAAAGLVGIYAAAAEAIAGVAIVAGFAGATEDIVHAVNDIFSASGSETRGTTLDQDFNFNANDIVNQDFLSLTQQQDGSISSI